MTYEERIEAAKARARKYLDLGKAADAIASILSDLSQGDEETKRSAAAMEPLGLLYAMNDDIDGARRFVEGFR